MYKDVVALGKKIKKRFDRFCEAISKIWRALVWIPSSIVEAPSRVLSSQGQQFFRLGPLSHAAPDGKPAKKPLLHCARGDRS
jgi:hypothetical protein